LDGSPRDKRRNRRDGSPAGCPGALATWLIPLPPFHSPVLLTESHDSAAFNSGEPALEEWLRQRAWAIQQLAASRTYVVCPTGSTTIIGYVALSMGQILAQEVTGAMRRNMPRHIPAVHLGRLAIDRAWQGKGLGRALLADVVRRALLASQEISARRPRLSMCTTGSRACRSRHRRSRLTS
jgi:GNAT superfamily N-acetyltransferase